MLNQQLNSFVIYKEKTTSCQRKKEKLQSAQADTDYSFQEINSTENTITKVINLNDIAVLIQQSKSDFEFTIIALLSIIISTSCLQKYMRCVYQVCHAESKKI